MLITIAPQCSNFHGGWLSQQYSANLTNQQKLMSNLSRIGHIDRLEWLESFDIICEKFKLYDLSMIQNITIEKFHFNKHQELMMTLSCATKLDLLIRFANFHLDSSLNIMRNFRDKENIEPNISSPSQNPTQTENKIEETQQLTRSLIAPKALSKSHRRLPFFEALTSPDDQSPREEIERPASPRPSIFRPMSPGFSQE